MICGLLDCSKIAFSVLLRCGCLPVHEHEAELSPLGPTESAS